MANSLLDFVMSVVRDPDVAAQYAANPAGTIADANLGDVTSVDVNNLIPVVAESLSSAVPTGGAGGFADSHDGNVWASGAATAAFDAFDSFDDHLHTQVVDQDQANQDQPVVHDTVPGQGPPMDFDLGGGDVPVLASAEEPAVHLDAPVIDDVPVLDTSSADHWGHEAIDQLHHQEDQGMDLFT
jgi:hypothetical protein